MDAGAAPTRGRGSIVRALRSLQDGYGLALILTVLTIFSLALGGVASIGGEAGVILAGCTLLFALSTSHVRPGVMRLAQVVVGVAIAASWAALIFGDPTFAALAIAAIGAAIAAIVPFVIIGHIVRSPTITYRLVIGALVVYLLIGLCYAYAFGILPVLTGDPFFVQTSTPNSATFLYFSFTTLSTVGYGDLSAATELGQMIAISEAIFGQLYLVSVVAILVSNVGRSFRDVSDE
jgi:hypothetical protein